MGLAIVKDLDGRLCVGNGYKRAVFSPRRFASTSIGNCSWCSGRFLIRARFITPATGADSMSKSYVAAFAGVVQPRAQRLGLGVLTGDAAGEVLMVKHVGWFDVARPDTCIFGTSCGRSCNAEMSAYAPPSRPTNYKTPCPPKIQAAMFMTS